MRFVHFFFSPLKALSSKFQKEEKFQVLTVDFMSLELLLFLMSSSRNPCVKSFILDDVRYSVDCLTVFCIRKHSNHLSCITALALRNGTS